MILLYLYVFFLNVSYKFFKLFCVNEKKILFLSRQTDKPSIDFRMMIDYINKNYKDYEIVTITKRIEKKPKDIIFKNLFIIFKQMYHLATCSICIVDGYNIPVSVLKHRDSLKVIQIWHSLGAIKKFGYQTLNTKKKRMVAKVMRMHKNYDVIISGSDSMIKYFSKAFNYDKSNFVSIGLPRIDYLLTRFKINRNKIYKEYPQFRNKKVILYVPTFREDNNYKFDELIEAVDHNKYIMIVKVHPKITYDISNNKYIYTCSNYTSLQLLSVSDYVITDYSAISIEASILNKPVFIYAYDIDSYSKNPGLNINLYKEFDGYVFTDAKKLYSCLDKGNYSMKVIEEYKNKYVKYCDGTVTERLVNYILKDDDNDV